MAKCDYCGTTILFGGVRDADMRFCNNNCHQAGHMARMCSQLPQDMIDEMLLEVHGGACPLCKGPGPIDVYTGHRIYSLLIFTSWTSPQRVCCRACGVKHQLGSAAISAVCGWWGFPWGIIGTPIQMVRNLTALASPPDSHLPSVHLEKIVRLQIGSAMLDHQRQEAMQAQNMTAAAPPTVPKN